MEEEICRILGAIVGKDPERIERNTSLAELGLDSVQRLEMVMELEELFNVVISDEEGEDFVTVADMVACLAEKENNRQETE